MSLDGIATRALAQELDQKLSGGRIDRIAQPDAHTMTIGVRAGGKNHKLYATINPQSARLSLTDSQYKSPLTPPQFCMVMRKHLQSAIIDSISQIDWERIIAMQVHGRNEIGELVHMTLIFELMGKNSNIILVSQEGRILDAMKRAGANTNKFRQLQPGLDYVAPPAQNKLALEGLTMEALSERILNGGLQKKINNALLQTVAGIGPQTAVEILIRCGISPDTRVDYLGEIDYGRIFGQCSRLLACAREAAWQPTLVTQGREVIAFAPFALTQFANLHSEKLADMTALLERYYSDREAQQRFDQKRSGLERIVRKERERCEKKLSLQLSKIDELEGAEKWRIYGELLTASLYRVKQGTQAVVPNFYEEGSPDVQIPMEPTLTPNENAQRYFKRYNKAKVGAEKASVQAEKTSQELNYLTGIEESLADAMTDDDLLDIRLELEEQGYAKRRQSSRSKEKAHAPRPIHLFVDGYEVFVGKNNHQNDYVTTKLGRGGDLWMHTKDIHGAHVIIKAGGQGRVFSDDIIRKGAMLAAWFSKARFSAKVPVDYTLRKFVHKPSGAKPGMVIYTDQQTFFTTPREEEVEALLKLTEEPQ